jgi:hypothetical protein
LHESQALTRSSLGQDSDIVSTYQGYFAADFESREAWERISQRGESLRVAIPPYERTHAGGIALPDVRPLLDASERDVHFQDPKYEADLMTETRQAGHRVMEVRIERASEQFPVRLPQP